MRQWLPHRVPWRRLWAGGFGLGLVVLAADLMARHVQLIRFPFPLEYREGAVPLITGLMVAGGNPYALDHHPVYASVYGILYHWLSQPFATLWGSTLTVHRGVSAAAILVACGVVYAAVRHRHAGRLAAAAVAVMLYASLLYYVIPLARPDALGVALYMAALYLPWRLKFSRLGCGLGVALGVLAFLAKAYFLLAVGALALYLFLFVSKRRGLAVAVAGGALVALSQVALVSVYPLYLFDTVLAYAIATGDPLSHLVRQLTTFAIWYRELLLLAVVFGALRWWQHRAVLRTVLRTADALRAADSKQQTADSGQRMADSGETAPPSRRWGWRGWRAPLIPGGGAAGVPSAPPACDYWVWMALVAGAAILWPLGGIVSNYMTYLLEVPLPPLLVLMGGVIQGLMRGPWAQPDGTGVGANGDRVSTDGAGVRWLPILVPVLTMVLVLTSVYRMGHGVLLRGDLDATRPVWNQLGALLMRHQNVYGNPAVVSLQRRLRQPIYDSGQSEYVLHAVDWARAVAPDITARATAATAAHRDRVQSMVAAGAFDLILLNARFSAERDLIGNRLTRNYRIQYRIQLPMPHSGRLWQLQGWVPKSTPSHP